MAGYSPWEHKELNVTESLRTYTHAMYLPPGRFSQVSKALIKLQEGDFSGGPLVNTLDFHCRELRFTPWLGN